MKSKIITILKRIVITILCIVTTTTAVISVIPLAKADNASRDMLGTGIALGSPVLNNNATLDNWNKWEMICWGVFLSNFCQPLIDNYRSAFQTGSGGSEGKGLKALQFGTGNDATNNDTIQALVTQAITYQEQVTPKDVFVYFVDVTNGVIGPKPDTTVQGFEDTLRVANFRDFFIESVANKTNDSGKPTSWITTKKANIANIKDYEFVDIDNGKLPIFYVKGEGEKYIEVLDYTNGWDLQMMSALYNAIDSEQESKFQKNFDEYFGADEAYPVKFDTFGNLLVADTMLFPACVNQHITKTKKINLLTSWITNNYVSTYSEAQLVNGLKQANYGNGFWNFVAGGGETGIAGVPAFGTSEIGQIGLLYFDTDSYFVSVDDTYSYGLKELFDSSIESTQNGLPLKFEISGSMLSSGFSATVLNNREPLEMNLIAAQIVTNKNYKQNYTSNILHEITYTNGDKIPLFDNDPVAVAVKVELPSQDSVAKNAKNLRGFFNFLYDLYIGTYAEIPNVPYARLNLMELLTTNSTDTNKLNGFGGDAIQYFGIQLDDKKIWQAYLEVRPDVKKDMPNFKFLDFGNDESFSKDTARVCLVYPVSKVMRNVSSILSIKDGTEFGVYSPYIYVTYLDFYGVINQTTLTSGTDQISEFDPALFPEGSEVLKFDPSTITPIKSEEEKQAEVLQLGYLMLHPEEGRTYRKELIYNGIADFLYEQYNRTVFGGKDSVYSGSASKSNSGFLAIETYSNNFLTGWFLNSYVDIAVWMIGVCCILVVIIGLLKSRKLSWFIMSIFTIVNVILLVPSSGEIVPYISSSLVQKMFSNKMEYWGIAEGIANASIETSAARQDGDMYGLSDEESTLVVNLVKQLNNVYTDRSLMLKQDISQKLTQKLDGTYTEIQSLQSARWVLPTIMQQYSSNEDMNNDGMDDGQYVYVSLSNTWDDGTNLFWYYNPDEASFVTQETATSSQFWTGSGPGTAAVATDNEKYSNIQSNYNAWTEETWAEDDVGINYACYSYTIKGDKNEQVHLYSWVNPNQKLEKSWKDSMGSFEDYENADSWEKFIDFEGTWGSTQKEYYKNNDEVKRAQDVESTYPEWTTDSGNETAFEMIADQYDRTKTDTLKPGYSFYKTTESPYYYFFNVVKDSFPDDMTFGSVIGRLQGKMIEDDDGNETRSNFMFATVGEEKEDDLGVINASEGYTEYVRDVVDLEELFTNVVPYLYTMTLYTGGFDGESGILLDTKISDESDYYEGNNQSWAYRCNWAVKLMENTQFSKPTTAYNLNGEKKTVTNPIMYVAYEDSELGRPMIFSEAQKQAYGLTDADLTLVELKCIAVNNDIAKKWTLLINYAGTPGMTKEVLYREMAIIATNSFCQEFSTGGIVDNRYSIYPQSLDLRYLSFDSVMKLLMINISKDTSYVYGDTMSVLLEETDMLTAVLLLIAAYLCSYWVPLFRCVLMAMIFYLGFLAIIRALFSSAAYKGKIACGQLISNLLFLVYTLAYYGCFCGLMALSSSDEVLSVKSVQANPGNPAWMVLSVIIISGVYMYLMYKQICFCFAHYRDMGFEIYSTVASAVTGKIQDAIDGLGDKFQNSFNGEENTSLSTSNTKSAKGTGRMGGRPQEVNIKASDDGLTIEAIMNKDKDNNDDTTLTPSFESGESGEYIDNDNSEAIDAQIKAGEEMESKK